MEGKLELIDTMEAKRGGELRSGAVGEGQQGRDCKPHPVIPFGL